MLSVCVWLMSWLITTSAFVLHTIDGNLWYIPMLLSMICFAIATISEVGIRDRIKKLEEKLKKLEEGMKCERM